MKTLTNSEMISTKDFFTIFDLKLVITISKKFEWTFEDVRTRFFHFNVLPFVPSSACLVFTKVYNLLFNEEGVKGSRLSFIIMTVLELLAPLNLPSLLSI